jgi:hypothetical protein
MPPVALAHSSSYIDSHLPVILCWQIASPLELTADERAQCEDGVDFPALIQRFDLTTNMPLSKDWKVRNLRLRGGFLVVERVRFGFVALLGDKHILTLHDAHLEKNNFESIKTNSHVFLLTACDQSARLRYALEHEKTPNGSDVMASGATVHQAGPVQDHDRFVDATNGAGSAAVPAAATTAGRSELPPLSPYAFLVAIPDADVAKDFKFAVALHARFARLLAAQASHHTLVMPRSFYLV